MGGAGSGKSVVRETVRARPERGDRLVTERRFVQMEEIRVLEGSVMSERSGRWASPIPVTSLGQVPA